MSSYIFGITLKINLIINKLVYYYVIYIAYLNFILFTSD